MIDGPGRESRTVFFTDVLHDAMQMSLRKLRASLCKMEMLINIILTLRSAELQDSMAGNGYIHEFCSFFTASDSLSKRTNSFMECL